MFFKVQDWENVVQSLSPVQLFATQWTAARQAFQSFTISWSLLKFMSIESVTPSNHLILHHPLLLLPGSSPDGSRVIRSKDGVGVLGKKSAVAKLVEKRG